MIEVGLELHIIIKDCKTEKCKLNPLLWHLNRCRFASNMIQCYFQWDISVPTRSENVLELSKHVHRNADMLLKNLKNVEIPFFFWKVPIQEYFLASFFFVNKWGCYWICNTHFDLKGGAKEEYCFNKCLSKYQPKSFLNSVTLLKKK